MTVNAQASIDVVNERYRQCELEDWDTQHDDSQVSYELAKAGMCYANPFSGQEHPQYTGKQSLYWPWGEDDWKPKSYRENLVRAGALIIAEIERIDRSSKDAMPQM